MVFAAQVVISHAQVILMIAAEKKLLIVSVSADRVRKCW